VGAHFQDTTLFQDDDQVGVPHRAGTVGNDHTGALVLFVCQSLPDGLFGFHVHSGGGVVQDQDGRTHRQSSCQGDTLALTAGKTYATLAHDGVVAIGHAADKAVGVGSLGEFHHVLFRQVFVAIGNVGVHRFGEEEHVLGGHTDVRPEVCQVVILHVDPVHQNFTRFRVEEAADEAGDGGFARAGGAHDGHRLAGFYVEVDILEHHVAVVGEGNVVEIDLTLEFFVLFDGVFPIDDVTLGVIELGDLLGGGQEAFKVGKERTDGAHGAGNGPGQVDVDGELADGKLAPDAEEAAKEDDQKGQGLGDGFHQGVDLQPGEGGLQVGIPVDGVVFVEALTFVFLVGKGLDHTVGFDVFLGKAVEFGELFTGGNEQRPGDFGELVAGDDEEGAGHHQNQGELPVDGEKVDQGGHVEHHRVDELTDNPGGTVAHHVQVTGEAGHQVAGAGLGVVLHVQGLHIFVKLGAQAELHALGGLIIEDDHQVAGTHAEVMDPHHQENQRNQFVHMADQITRSIGDANDHPVDNASGNGGSDDDHGGHQSLEDVGHHVSAVITLQVLPDPLHSMHLEHLPFVLQERSGVGLRRSPAPDGQRATFFVYCIIAFFPPDGKSFGEKVSQFILTCFVQFWECFFISAPSLPMPLSPSHLR